MEKSLTLDEIYKISEQNFLRDISSWDFTKDDVCEFRKKYLKSCDELKEEDLECYTGQEDESSVPISFGKRDKMKNGLDSKYSPFISKGEGHTKHEERELRPERYIGTENNKFIKIVQFYIKLHSESIKHAWECFEKSYNLARAKKPNLKKYDLECFDSFFKGCDLITEKPALDLPLSEILDIYFNWTDGKKSKTWAGGRYFFIFGEKGNEGSISYKLNKFNRLPIEFLRWDLTKSDLEDSVSDSQIFELFVIDQSISA